MFMMFHARAGHRPGLFAAFLLMLLAGGLVLSLA